MVESANVFQEKMRNQGFKGTVFSQCAEWAVEKCPVSSSVSPWPSNEVSEEIVPHPSFVCTHPQYSLPLPSGVMVLVQSLSHQQVITQQSIMA